MISEYLLHIPPAFILIAGAFIIPLINNGVRGYVALLLSVITLMQIWSIPVGEKILTLNIAGFDLSPLYAHQFSRIFGTIFAIAAFGGALFGLNQSKPLETASAFIYAGSAIGVVFSGDLISLFIYWEIMAVSSTIVILSSDIKGAKGAGLRYAAIHFMGGVILMSGIIAQVVLSGDASISSFNSDNSLLLNFYPIDMSTVAMWLILIGVLINTAAPPISAWLPDSYPQGSPFGSVYLSAFTTKTAVFVLLTMFPGAQVLIYIGLFMIFYGIIYAILENDMRRILSYSIINQVGFMITGIGIGTDLALKGVAAHAFCHIIYKALLFMSAGSVLYMTGKSKCSQLGGLYHSMKITSICGIIGALAISAFPLTSGFVSKSVISSAASHEHLAIVWFLLVAASAGVFLHAGIKFPWFVFFQQDSGLRPKDPPLNMRIAMILFAVLCIIPAIPGVTEKTLYRLLPGGLEYNAYSFDHVVAQLQLLLFSGLAFFVMLPMLKRTETISLDFDWFYRSFARYIILAGYFMSKVPLRALKIYLRKRGKRMLGFAYDIYSPDGVIARGKPIGVTVTWVIALLGVYLIVYYT